MTFPRERSIARLGYGPVSLAPNSDDARCSFSRVPGVLRGFAREPIKNAWVWRGDGVKAARFLCFSGSDVAKRRGVWRVWRTDEDPVDPGGPVGRLANIKPGQNGSPVSNREFAASNQGVLFTLSFIGPRGSGPFWYFSIAPRNDFGWVGPVKTKVNGTPCFGADHFRFWVGWAHQNQGKRGPQLRSWK